MLERPTRLELATSTLQGGALPDELRPHTDNAFLRYRGPRKDLRSKGLWGEGENLVFITEVLLARLPDE